MKMGILALFVVLGFARVGMAHPQPCLYEVFQPVTLLDHLRFELRDRGIAELPAAYPVYGLPPGRINFLHKSAVVGQATVEVNIRTGSSDVIFFDTRKRILARATEKAYPCPFPHPTGLCRELTFTTELDSATPTQIPAFSISRGPDFGIRYLRYGNPIGAFQWRHEYRDSVEWLLATLANPEVYFLVKTGTAKERLFFALASDPWVAPYVHRLTLIEGSQRLIIKGRVPSNYVYGLVIDRAREVGLVNIDPQLIIDTRIAIPPYLAPLLSSCFR